MKIACTGFVSEKAGSVASANALLLRELLSRGHELVFFSKPDFVDPRPAIGSHPGFSFVPVVNAVEDRLRKKFQDVPFLGFLAERLDARSYNRLLVCTIQLAHKRCGFDAVLWLGDHAAGRINGLPAISFAQGAPGTDARSILRHVKDLESLCGMREARRLTWLARLRLSRFGLPPMHFSDAILVGSSVSVGTLQNIYRIPPDQTHALPYPIDLELFQVADSTAPKEGLSILWLGRFVPRKRLDLILEAARLVIGRGLDLRITIVGSSAGLGNYETWIHNFEFPERLRHFPHLRREEVPALMAAHDLLVQPSDEENFGSSVAEAQACGLPVVVGCTNGNADYLAACDFHLADDKAETLAAVLIEAAERKGSGRLRDSKASRALAEIHFSLPEVAAKMESILEQTIARRILPDGVEESFDVFETAIIRDTWPPEFLHLRVGRALQASGFIESAADYFRCRLQAETEAFENLGASYTLEKIENILRTLPGMETIPEGRMAQAETEAELDAAYPCARIRSEIRRAVLDHHPLHFVSDTWHPPELIRALLEETGAWCVGANIHLSHEHGVFKRSGKLFRSLQKQGLLPRGKIRHTGNSKTADQQGARLAGIRARYFPEGNPNSWENALVEEAPDSELASRLAGASRVARLARDYPHAGDRVLVEVAASVLAPALILFFCGMVREARRLGCQKVHLMARDMWLLHRIAFRETLRAAVPDLQFEYLEASRRAWLFPSLGVANLGWACDHLAPPSPEDFAEYLQIDPALIRAVVKGQNRLSPECLDALLANPAVREALTDRAVREARNLRAYLHKTGLASHSPRLLVDLGWRGSLHRALNRILVQDGFTPLRGFLFGLDDSKDAPAGIVSEFTPGSVPGSKGQRIPDGIKFLLEAVLTAPTGSLLWHGDEESGFAPVRAHREADSDEKSRRFILEDTITRTFEVFFRRGLPEDAEWEICRAPVIENLAKLASRPGHEEAMTLGALPSDAGSTVRPSSRPLAAPLSWRDLIDWASGRRPAKFHECCWKAASIRLSPFPIRWSWKILSCLRKILRKGPDR